MKILRLLSPLLLLNLLVLSGCVSAPAPVPAGYNGPLAAIADTSNPVSSTKIQFFQLAAVDGRTVRTSSAATYQQNYGKGFYMEPVLETRDVPAQECILHLEGVTHVAADILAFGGGMFHVKGDVKVALEQGKKYFVMGELSKEYCAVWLEDAAGQPVSPKVEKRRK